MIKRTSRLLAVAMVLLLMSCSGNDYLRVIPRDSVAMASIDLKQMKSEGETPSFALPKDVFGNAEEGVSGVDLASTIYAFETSDGTLGLVAHVDDSDMLTDFFTRMSEKSKCSKPEERRGNHFAMVNDSWLVGYSDDALIAIGPITLMQRSATEQRMHRLFAQDVKQGAQGSRIFQRLDSLNAPIALVAQVSALPEKFMLPFTIGMPKGADASQVMLSATMNNEDGVMVVRGKTFSFNGKINNALQENDKVFRPITDDMLSRMSPSDMGFLFMNAKGGELLKVLQQSAGMQALLAGANTAVDMDNIIRSIDGDIILSLANMEGDFDFSARLSRRDFLSDIGYWKKSCPAGSSISDMGKDAYVFNNGSLSYSFCVTSDNLFLSSLRHGETLAKEDVAMKLPSEISSKIVGSRLAMLIDLGKTGNQTVTDIVKPMLGGVDRVLYIKE